MLFLHRNNRMERLLEELADVLAVPRRDPLTAEVIVVQSLGMERWLAMGLASRFGVWGNGLHPFPRAFIQTISDSVIGALDDSQRYTREAMTFHLASILGDLPKDDVLGPLRAYLTARPGVEARLQLAERLADSFDQAQIYRPDWCLDWTSGAPAAADEFHPALFRLLTQRLGEHHFPAQVLRLIGHLMTGTVERDRLPERVSLFGVATLPPAFIQVFDALARHIEVHWFLLTASREYLGSERDKRELAHATMACGNFGGAAAHGLQQELSSQQPLLAAYGRIMRDVGLLLERDCHYDEASRREFVEPETTTVLQTLQADLCALRRRGTAAEVPKLSLRPDDRSLEVHACHGPRRELEVLRELLLDAFECDPTLRPEDVIVLLRDVETYAPLVDAVFATERGQVGSIPYRLADRTAGATNPIAEAVLVLLDVARARLTGAELLRLLELRPVANRFELSVEDLAQIADWLRELHVTWGVDMADRKREGALGQPEHTLRFGLTRLILGAAIGGTRQGWRGLLPVELEGEAAEVAGKFVDCAEAIFAFREQLLCARPFLEWHTVIANATKELFRVEAADSWQLADLLQTTAKFSAEAAGAKFDEAVPARVLAERIRNHYENTRTTQALLTGGVTFCAMLPMRGIPARIVAMVGLDDGTFPRAASISSFDAVARSPSRPGDRVGRDEDRHLFLETLLAARERLIITYLGRNPRDDTARARSVVVDELLTVVDESFESSLPGVSPSQRLTVVHPLHAHSRRYFDGSDARLVGRDLRQFYAAATLEASRFAPEPGMTEALPPVHYDRLELDVLERFWTAPAEFFYQARLGAWLGQGRTALEALDPTDLDALGRYQLTWGQWQAIADGRGPEEALAQWTAQGQRPYSNLGKVVHDEQLLVTQRLHATLARLHATGRTEPLDLQATVSGVELNATIVDRFDIGRVDWSPARLSGKHRLIAWLRHLMLSAGGVPVDTWIVRRNAKSEEPIAIEKLVSVEPSYASEQLEALVAQFHCGQRLPLPFFAEISWNYAVRSFKGEPHLSCLERAMREYGDPLFNDDGDFTKPVGPREVMRLFGAAPPLTEAWPNRFGVEGAPSFQQLAELVFFPYLSKLSVIDADEVVEPLGSEPAPSVAARGVP